MFRLLTGLSLRLLRLASNVLFCYELNRALGRATRGSIRHRQNILPRAEASLLQHIQAYVCTGYVQVDGGIRIHTIIAGIAAMSSSSAQHDDHNPIVLLHGHSMSGATFFRNVDDLLQQGFTSVYMPDLPGFGRSTRPRFPRHETDGVNADAAIDFFVEPLRQWLHAMKLKSFTLAGHSLGGYIAHECTIRLHRNTMTQFKSSASSSSSSLQQQQLNQLEVKRLIMISPAAVQRTTRLSHALWFCLTPQRVLTCGGLIAQLLFTTKYPSSPAYNAKGMRQFALLSNSISHCSGDAASAAILRFARTGRLSWRAECVRPIIERTNRLPCPVHIVAGGQDELVPVHTLRHLYDHMVSKGNDMAITVLRHADHSPHIVSPVEFAKALARVDVSRRVVHRRVTRLCNEGILRTPQETFI